MSSPLGPRNLVRLSTPPSRWLARAFGIFGDEPPSDLEPTISPVLDVAQGGWADAAFSSGGSDRTTSGVSSIVTGPALVWVALSNSGASATTGAQIRLQNAETGGFDVNIWAVEALAANFAAGHAQMLGGAAPIVVPAGYRLYVQSLALTPSGNTHVWRWVIGSFKAGLKMW